MTPAHVRSRTVSAVLTLSGVLFALVVATSTATASSNTASSHPDLGTQTRSLGLTSTQAATLQAQVNSYISRLGGTQVAINKIDLGNGAYAVLALPGKKSAKNFCYYGYFCAYSGTDFQGTAINMYACRSYQIPFSGPGSWANNQTKGTQARMYNKAGKLIYTTPPAYSQSTDGSWTSVVTVRNC